MTHTPKPWMILSPAIVTTTAGLDWAAHVIADVRKIEDAHLIAALQERFSNMRSNESGSARYKI